MINCHLADETNEVFKDFIIKFIVTLFVYFRFAIFTFYDDIGIIRKLWKTYAIKIWFHFSFGNKNFCNVDGQLENDKKMKKYKKIMETGGFEKLAGWCVFYFVMKILISI